jgi:hypothetical protein
LVAAFAEVEDPKDVPQTTQRVAFSLMRVPHVGHSFDVVGFEED